MSDSPKCLNCLKKGLVGQTYKIAGKGLFKCSDCKTIYPRESFQPIEFIWRDDPETYSQWIESKGIKLEKV